MTKRMKKTQKQKLDEKDLMIADFKNRYEERGKYLEESRKEVWELERQVALSKTAKDYQRGNYEVTFEFKVNIPAESVGEAERAVMTKLFDRIQELCHENQYSRYGISGWTGNVQELVCTELFGLPKKVERKH